MRARTGALTTWVDCASWISRSPMGSISQNVSVKSKGEFWMEQKFEYTRGVVWSSSGTMVKLTAFLVSSIGVLAPALASFQRLARSESGLGGRGKPPRRKTLTQALFGPVYAALSTSAARR